MSQCVNCDVLGTLLIVIAIINLHYCYKYIMTNIINQSENSTTCYQAALRQVSAHYSYRPCEDELSISYSYIVLFYCYKYMTNIMKKSKNSTTCYQAAPLNQVSSHYSYQPCEGESSNSYSYTVMLYCYKYNFIYLCFRVCNFVVYFNMPVLRPLFTGHKNTYDKVF